MRNLFKWALVTVLFMALVAAPALAKKKPIERTVIEGVTLAEVKTGSQFPPYYPATARTTNYYAEVVVSLQVNQDGKVGEVEVIQASVEDVGFEQSATDAVKHWRFHPALRDGQAIETATLVRLTFAPPSLKYPEGYVYTDTSPQEYGVTLLRDLLGNDASELKRNYSRASFLNEFLGGPADGAKGNRLTNHSNRERLKALEIPPCPDRRPGCIYDRSLLDQFGGGGSDVIHRPVPDSSRNTQGTSRPTNLRPGGRR